MISIKRRQLLTGAGSMLLGAALPRSVLAAVKAPAHTLVAAYFGGWDLPMDPAQRYIHGDNPWATYPTAALPMVHKEMLAKNATASNASDPLSIFKYENRIPWYMDPSDAKMQNWDESQQSVMDLEINKASSYGLDVFAMNWYRDDFLNYPVVNFKASSVKAKMKFFLQWSNNSNVSKAPPSDTREYFFESMRRAAIHMRDSSYWKQSGLPVFAIFDVSQIQRIINASRGVALTYVSPTTTEATLTHDAFLQDLHNIVANVLKGDNTGGISGTLNSTVVKGSNGKVPTSVNTSGIVGSFTPSMYLMLATADVGSWARCNTVQGLYNYDIRSGNFNGVNRMAHNFTEMMTACQQNYDLLLPAMKAYAPTKVFWPTIMAGFDMRPWGGTASDPLADNCIATPAEFETHCKQVRTTLDQNTATTNSTAFIYAWNELGEGGFIEPTHVFGDTRLASLHNNFKT